MVEVVTAVDVADVVSNVDFDDVEVEDGDVDDTEDVDGATEVLDDDEVEVAGFVDVVEAADDVDVVEDAEGDAEVDVVASVVVACVGMVEHLIQ